MGARSWWRRRRQDVIAVLAGDRPYDSLSPKEQAVVRAEWSARTDARRETLDLAERFATAGRRWVELDEHGAVVERSVAPKRDRPRRSANPRPADG